MFFIDVSRIYTLLSTLHFLHCQKPVSARIIKRMDQHLWVLFKLLSSTLHQFIRGCKDIMFNCICTIYTCFYVKNCFYVVVFSRFKVPTYLRNYWCGQQLFLIILYLSKLRILRPGGFKMYYMYTFELFHVIIMISMLRTQFFDFFKNFVMNNIEM